jgi:pilus assembly protein CpaE
MAARILVVSDDTSLQRLLGHAMNGEGHEVFFATNGNDGLRRWVAEQHDLVIVDANVANMDGFALVEKVRANEPPGTHIPIVMLGGADPRAKVRGLRSGADDYQSLPVHPAELLARVRRLLARLAPRPVSGLPGPTRAQVLAFYGAKGGVGTTTLAINTAIALHRVLRRSVVLVDADLQFGDHRVFLDLGNDKRSIVDAVTAPAIDGDLLRQVVVRHDSGIDLLLAPPNPETAEHISAERHHMAQIVETLRGMYDYVVVDVDKRLDDHSLDVIAAADRLFVVMTADLSCIKNVRLVLQTMSQIGIQDDRVDLLLNRSNAYTGISAKSIEAVLKRGIPYQVVNDYRAAISALNSGEPFMHARADSLIGRSLLEFVRAVDAAPVAPRAAWANQALIPAVTS